MQTILRFNFRFSLSLFMIIVFSSFLISLFSLSISRPVSYEYCSQSSHSHFSYFHSSLIRTWNQNMSNNNCVNLAYLTYIPHYSNVGHVLLNKIINKMIFCMDDTNLLWTSERSQRSQWKYTNIDCHEDEIIISKVVFIPVFYHPRQSRGGNRRASIWTKSREW